MPNLGKSFSNVSGLKTADKGLWMITVVKANVSWDFAYTRQRFVNLFYISHIANPR